MGPFTWLQIQQKPQNTVTKCLPPQQSRIKYQNPQRSETHIIIFLSLFAHLQTSTLTVRETHTNRRITTQPQNDEVGADMPSSYLQKLDLGATSSSLALLLLLFLLVVIIINKKRAEKGSRMHEGPKGCEGCARKRERTRLTWMTMLESSSSCISHSLILLLMIRWKREEEEILLVRILGRLFVRLGFLSSSSSYKAPHHHLPPCLLLSAIAFRE